MRDIFIPEKLRKTEQRKTTAYKFTNERLSRFQRGPRPPCPKPEARTAPSLPGPPGPARSECENVLVNAKAQTPHPPCRDAVRPGPRAAASGAAKASGRLGDAEARWDSTCAGDKPGLLTYTRGEKRDAHGSLARGRRREAQGRFGGLRGGPVALVGLLVCKSVLRRGGGCLLFFKSTERSSVRLERSSMLAGTRPRSGVDTARPPDCTGRRQR